MANDLAPLGTNEPFDLASFLPEKTTYEDDAGSLMKASSSGFIPYLRHYNAGTNLCKGGDFPTNNYGLHTTPGKKPEVDLGKTFVALILARRPLACDVSGDTKGRYYDPKAPEFQALEEQAKGGGLAGALVGMEWLLWLPTHGFATLHFNNASLKNIQETAYKSYRGKFVRFGVREAKTTKHTWYTPKIDPCSETYAFEGTREEFVEITERFGNPVSKGPQLADTSGEGASTDRAH